MENPEKIPNLILIRNPCRRNEDVLRTVERESRLPAMNEFFYRKKVLATGVSGFPLDRSGGVPGSR